MAQELLVAHTSGTVVYATIRIPIRDNIGDWWNNVTQTLEVFNPANWANYAIAMVELGTTGFFEGDIPGGNLGSEDHTLEVYFFERVGAAPVMGDTHVAGSLFQILAYGWVAVAALRV